MFCSVAMSDPLLWFSSVSRQQHHEEVLPADRDGGGPKQVPDDGHCSSAQTPLTGPPGALRKVNTSIHLYIFIFYMICTWIPLDYVLQGFFNLHVHVRTSSTNVIIYFPM